MRRSRHRAGPGDWIQIANQIVENHRQTPGLSPADANAADAVLNRSFDRIAAHTDLNENRLGARQFESDFEVLPECKQLRRDQVGAQLRPYFHPASPLLALVVHHTRLRLQDTQPEFNITFKDYQFADSVLRKALNAMIDVTEPGTDMTKDHVVDILQAVGQLHPNGVGDVDWVPLGCALAYAAKLIGGVSFTKQHLQSLCELYSFCVHFMQIGIQEGAIHVDKPGQTLISTCSISQLLRRAAELGKTHGQAQQQIEF